MYGRASNNDMRVRVVFFLLSQPRIQRQQLKKNKGGVDSHEQNDRIQE